MKIKVLSGIFLLAITLMVGCTKSKNNTTNETIITIKNGVIDFYNTALYLKAAENKNSEQHYISDFLRASNFNNLAKKSPVNNSNNQSSQITTSANSINIITSSFNPDLYTDFLLEILNTDKICSINGYWVKVDLDNAFCSIIDANAYPGEYDDLKNNVFSNTHIMTFTDPNEPVIKIIDALRTNQITWDGYQEELARKGGQGICLKRGATGAVDAIKLTNIVQGKMFRVVSSYIRGFIHFQLWSWADAFNYPVLNTSIVNLRVNYTYEYEGVCEGSGSGSGWYASKQAVVGSSGYYSAEGKVTVYGGGSALKVRKMLSKGYLKIGTYSENINDYVAATPYPSIGY